MTKILLNSRGFVTEVMFFHILPFSYRSKNFLWRKTTKFWLGGDFPDEKFCPRKVLPDEIFPDKVVVFPKSVVTPQKYVLLLISMQSC